MSKQDSQFFNVFSLVIGLLVAIAIVLMVVARGVGASTQKQHVLEDQRYRDGVAARVAPLGRVAVAGQDNSALAILEKAPGGEAGAAALPKDGNEVFQQACSACHGAGIGGARKAGDKAAWGPRIAQGKDTLYKHALEGFQGKAGVMPARGGRADLTDDLVKAGVDHMVDMAK